MDTDLTTLDAAVLGRTLRDGEISTHVPVSASKRRSRRDTS